MDQAYCCGRDEREARDDGSEVSRSCGGKCRYGVAGAVCELEGEVQGEVICVGLNEGKGVTIVDGREGVIGADDGVLALGGRSLVEDDKCVRFGMVCGPGKVGQGWGR